MWRIGAGEWRSWTLKRAAVLLFLLLETVDPESSPATTITASSCSRESVGAAVTASTYGDTVTVPAGNCTWASTLTIARGITLRGAGPGVTNITSGAGTTNFLIVYAPDATAITADTPFAVTGFTLNLNGASGGIHLQSNSTTTAITNVRIYGNVISNAAGTGSSTDVACLRVGDLRSATDGQVYGLIYENTFTNCASGVQAYGMQDVSWNGFVFAFGSKNNLYIEDNTFTGNDAFHYGGAGGRYVARFNTYNFTDGDYELVWDAHGNQPGGVYATMGCEIYRNTVSIARSTTVLDHRGGKCLVFDNTTTGTPGNWQIREEYDDAISPTTNPQPQHVSDSYYVGNRHNGSIVTATETQDCCGGAITSNVDYFNEVVSFTGSAGIGRGVLSARPETCTTGVGYWATDQGSWNLSGRGGQGVLYKCIAQNTWRLYYVPLTYPHPLRTDSSNALAAPTGLTVW